MKKLFLITALIGLSTYGHAQCNIPYGKKVFHLLQKHRMNLPNPSIVLNSIYTDISVEIRSVTYQGETKDMLILNGEFLGGASPNFIIGRNCEKIRNGTLYTIICSSKSDIVSFSLLTDINGNFITFSILGEKGEKTFITLK